MFRAPAVGVMLAVLAVGASTGQSPCQLVRIESTMPGEVCEDAGSQNDVRFFDAFSWQSFLAITWPAARTRGEPDLSLPVGTTDRPLVFETYKPHWEVFVDARTPTRPGPPAEWSMTPQTSPCGAVRNPDDLVISSLGKLEDLAQAGFGPRELQPPIVSQNREYVRYTMHYNRVLFDAIVRQQLYLASRLNKVTLPYGSVAVKAAWMILNAGSPRPQRYYRRFAQVRRIDGSGCDRKEVALIALHVIEKTPRRPQFVWSTFEHVDNYPYGEGTGPFALHNGLLTSRMPLVNPLRLHQLPADPEPFNITGRPSHPSTTGLNERYRAALSSRRAIWANYRLVMTQWPRSVAQPHLPGTPIFTIPGTPATRGTSYANPAIETFFQAPIEKGCMNCHDLVRERSDFVWSFAMHAWRDPRSKSDMKNRDTLFRKLGKLVDKDRDKAK